MLNPVYFAVSAVLQVWHQLFALLLGPATGAAWALAVVFLVLTGRTVLLPAARAQLRAARASRAIAPQLAELKKRHASDPQRLVSETRALHRAHGVTLRASLVPALVQLPVFVGLLHVLRSFDRPGLSVAQNAALANYSFGPDDVASFLDARLGGAPLSAWTTMPQAALAQFGAERLDVVLVGGVLLVLLAAATYLTTRRLAVSMPLLRLLPVGVLVGGLVLPFPVAILLYGLTQSGLTAAQQYLADRAARASGSAGRGRRAART